MLVFPPGQGKSSSPEQSPGCPQRRWEIPLILSEGSSSLGNNREWIPQSGCMAMHCTGALPSPAPAIISWPPCACNLEREGSLESQLYSPHVHYTRHWPKEAGKVGCSQGSSSKSCENAFAGRRCLSLIHTKALRRQTGSSPRPISLYSPRVSGADCPGQCRTTA